MRLGVFARYLLQLLQQEEADLAKPRLALKDPANKRRLILPEALNQSASASAHIGDEVRQRKLPLQFFAKGIFFVLAATKRPGVALPEDLAVRSDEISRRPATDRVILGILVVLVPQNRMPNLPFFESLPG